jgi:LytS/YehU family sensor histidine kinase
MKPGSSTMDLSIAAHQENGSLILQVTDNGAGLGAQDTSSVFGRGVGLANIRDRLAQLYGEKQELAIANRATGGAEVTLRVPFHAAGPVQVPTLVTAQPCE